MKSASTLAFVLLAACGSEQSSSSSALTREPHECSDVEVHVIGVADAGDDATVVLERPGRHVLVVSSRAEATWNIRTRNGAILEGVYAVGHEPQHIKTTATTRILTESAMEGGAGANGYEVGSRDVESLLKLVSIRTNLHATSFHGCFAAKSWTIGENLTTTSDCASGTHTQYDAVVDCDGDNACGDDGGDGGGGGGFGSDGSLY